MILINLAMVIQDTLANSDHGDLSCQASRGGNYQRFHHFTRARTVEDVARTFTFLMMAFCREVVVQPWHQAP